MKILFDTNVILDLLLDRQPYTSIASELISLVEANSINGVLGATTITTIDYLLIKVFDRHHSRTVVAKLLKIFEIAAVNRLILENALISKFSDYEDAVLHEAAIEIGAQAIVTRDTKGFKHATVSIYKPDEFLKMLAGLKTPSH